MNLRTELHYDNRINMLKSKDPVANEKLIKKLERRKRALNKN